MSSITLIISEIKYFGCFGDTHLRLKGPLCDLSPTFFKGGGGEKKNKIRLIVYIIFNKIIIFLLV